jgi:hypothetical protein
MAEKCKPVDIEHVLIVDVRGDLTKHTGKTVAHKYTYESSEVFPDGQGKDQYNAVLMHVVWKCTICGRIITQVKRFSAPRKCADMVEVEDADTDIR